MSLNAGLFTSAKQDWQTPIKLFDTLHAEFDFTTDTAANPTNFLCPDWYGPGSPFREDALSGEPWEGRCWCNPPYGRDLDRWIDKAIETVCIDDTPLVVMLIPARTETKWFYEIVSYANEIRFLRGRLRFSELGSAPFPSALAVFRAGPSIPLAVNWVLERAA